MGFMAHFVRFPEHSVPVHHVIDSWNAAGGLLTTINDMVHWDAFLRRNDKLPAGEYLLAFLRDGSLLGNEQCLSAFPKERYRGLPRFWYTGGGMGFMAHFVRFPEHGLSIIAFGNNSTNRGWHDSVNSYTREATGWRISMRRRPSDHRLSSV